MCNVGRLGARARLAPVVTYVAHHLRTWYLAPSASSMASSFTVFIRHTTAGPRPERLISLLPFPEQSGSLLDASSHR